MHTYHTQMDTGKGKKRKTLFLGQFKDPSPLVMSCAHYDSLTVTNLHDVKLGHNHSLGAMMPVHLITR